MVGYEQFFPVVAYNEADMARGASAELSQSAAKHQDPRQAVQVTGAVLGYALWFSAGRRASTVSLTWASRRACALGPLELPEMRCPYGWCRLSAA